MRFCFWLITGAALLTSPAMAGSVLPLNLADLAQRASAVVEARCLQVEVSTVPIEGSPRVLPVYRYTFEVVDVLKGKAPQRWVVQQLRKPEAPGEFGLDPSLIGMPAYSEGSKYVLFMGRTGRTGLCSPIGMWQGCFNVKDGQAFNLDSNAHILKGMANVLSKQNYGDLVAAAAKQGQDGLPLLRFKALIRDLVSGAVQAPGRAEVAQ